MCYQYHLPQKFVPDRWIPDVDLTPWNCTQTKSMVEKFPLMEIVTVHVINQFGNVYFLFA